MINSTICCRINKCQQKAHLKWNGDHHHHHVLVDRNGLYETVVLAKGIHRIFFSSFSPFLSLIIAKEWVHLHFFVILAKKYTQHNCITKFEHLQIFMSVRLIVKYANTSTTMSKYSIWTVINEYLISNVFIEL